MSRIISHAKMTKSGPRRQPQVIISSCCMLLLMLILNSNQQAESFHLSFGHRLLRSILAQQQPAPPQLPPPPPQHLLNSQPQLNPPENLIRPIECRNANNHSEAGICMFSIDCMQSKGVPLSICKHNYFVGTCCKLPAHNNFVGIVYDLRETETMQQQQQQQLEARRDGGIPASSQVDSSQPSAAQSGDSGAGSSAALHAYSVQQQQQRLSNPISQSTSPKVVQVSPSDTTASSWTDKNEQTSSQTTKLFDDSKYLISSTRLFGSSGSAPTSAAPPQAQSSSTTSSLSTAAASPKVEQRPAGNVGETARNADGPTQQQPASSALGEPTIQLVSSQLAFGGDSALQQQQEHPRQSQQQNASSVYELVGSGASTQKNASEDLQAASEQSQQTIVVSSAHSPNGPSASQQQQANQNNIYLLTSGDNSQQESSQADQAQTTHKLASGGSSSSSIVFSNNHQQQAAEATSSSSASSISSTSMSDQEFTLSTSSLPAESQASSQSASSSAPSDGPSSPSPAVAPSSTQQQQQATAAPPSEHLTSLVTQQQQVELEQKSSPSSPSASSSSPYVDLVSSSSSSSSISTPHEYPHTSSIPETTTPFTSSLSTALLPNVSSHPYAPTTLAPALPSTSSSSSSQQTLVSTPTTSTALSSQKATTSTEQQQHHSSSPPVFVPQYYSTQSVGTSTTTVSTRPTMNLSFPNLNSPTSLQAASSKIVTGSSAGTNNLIPSLSGLQSAILAHIPFKIASGLSSGLSSYLQAAIKQPTHANRPLISSNTAPALQYQQQHNNTHPKPTQASGSTLMTAQSAVRFPSPSSTSSTTISAVATSSELPSPAAPSRDVIKEAQLVCGRPQVPEFAAASSSKTKRVARIVGGNQSAFGQWPWMVSLRQWRKGAFLHKCGAALLNENWAITAAHCVENVKAADLLLRLGEFDVSNQNEPYPYTERRVKTVVSHPSFDPKTFEYDLALLRFTEPIQYERNIVPVCVPNGNDSYVDRMATVIGWGRLFEDGPLPDVIQHVDVPIITNQECEKMYKNAGFVEEIPEMFICAGISKGGRDSCEGDSGGPLTMVDHDGRSYLVGIISWGIGCALPSQPGVYTRITAFSPWINQIITN